MRGALTSCPSEAGRLNERYVVRGRDWMQHVGGCHKFQTSHPDHPGCHLWLRIFLTNMVFMMVLQMLRLGTTTKQCPIRSGNVDRLWCPLTKLELAELEHFNLDTPPSRQMTGFERLDLLFECCDPGIRGIKKPVFSFVSHMHCPSSGAVDVEYRNKRHSLP